MEVNIWGFAYVGGIIGLFVSGLLFVQIRLAKNSPVDSTARAGGIASLGRLLVVAGACGGAALGLGVGLLVEFRTPHTPDGTVFDIGSARRASSSLVIDLIGVPARMSTGE